MSGSQDGMKNIIKSNLGNIPTFPTSNMLKWYCGIE